VAKTSHYIIKNICGKVSEKKRANKSATGGKAGGSIYNNGKKG